MTTYVKVEEVEAPIARHAYCPNKGRGCESMEVVKLPANWAKQVKGGKAVEIIGCGNPWHYDFTNG